MKSKGILEEKTYEFALFSIQIYQHLVKEKKEFIISKQFLRSATSIGANVREATGAQSKADFIAKLSIAHKESLETEYWVNLLKDSGILGASTAHNLLEENQTIIRIITKSLLTSKQNLTNSQQLK